MSMNPIKAFFNKRKFRAAGPGHRLDESASQHRAPDKRSQPTPVHRPPSDIAKRAAEAAISRAEQKQKQDVNWSLAAVRAQARKELELEVQAAERSKHAPKEVFKESCSLLAVSGVYFTCPLIGPYILPYKEIATKIKEFLYSQLEEERGLTACLMIHTLNKDKEKVKLGIETLSRYLTNIIDNPSETKYHKIRVKNKVFQERIVPLEGSFDFLLAAGFVQQKEPQGDQDEDFFVFPEDQLGDLDKLQMMKDALLSAEPILPELDRNKRVLMPSQSTEKINLPSDFFNLSAEELLREQEARAHAVELNSQIRTKAMKERDEIREQRFYKYSLIRIRFPDGIILQGTFSVREKLQAVKDFIVENLAQPDREYILLVPGGLKLTDDDSTLLELKLIPAAILNLRWDSEDIQSGEEVAYLKSETMCLLQQA